jgi:hypothetical protein
LGARVGGVPPIARFDAADPDCTLDLVASRPRQLESATPTLLTLNWSWSGQCSALVACALPA